MNAVLEIINYEEVNELCCLRGTMTTNQIHRVAIPKLTNSSGDKQKRGNYRYNIKKHIIH